MLYQKTNTTPHNHNIVIFETLADYPIIVFDWADINGHGEHKTPCIVELHLSNVSDNTVQFAQLAFFTFGFNSHLRQNTSIKDVQRFMNEFVIHNR